MYSTWGKAKGKVILGTDFSTEGMVDGAFIKDLSITNLKLKGQSVDSRVIENYSIQSIDLDTGAVDARVLGVR